MKTREIIPNEWQPFLNDFSKRHQGEFADIQVIDEEIGAQYEAEGLPFVGIVSDDTGSEQGSISVILGTEPNDHVEHRVRHPRHLWVKSAADRGKDALEIEDEHGTKTILQLQPPPLLR
jgi:hypothetical protein